MIEFLMRVGELVLKGIGLMVDWFMWSILKLAGGFNKGSKKASQGMQGSMERGRVTKCPKCKSVNVNAVSRGFSKRKAVTGGLLFGRVGVLLGVNGGKQHWHCNTCGKGFKR